MNDNLPKKSVKATQQMPEQDLRALFLYLRSVPPLHRSAPPPVYAEIVQTSRGAERGKLLFAARCEACHGTGGAGNRATSVRLDEAASAFTDSELRAFIEKGDADMKMPGFRKTLPSDQLEDIIAYMRTRNMVAHK